MKVLLRQIVFLPPGVKLVFAILGILAIYRAVHLLEIILPSHFGRVVERYRVRKIVGFAGYVFAILLVLILFEDRLGRLNLALGVAGAGLVVALQDVIASFAGWFAISISGLYRVGDRVQVGETKGDVIDISIVRTTLMEIGNWVRGDLYNGRMVRIPNNLVLKGPVFNYSQEFRFVWDEIKVPLTAHSDHRFAREMLLRVAQETVAHFLVEAEVAWKRITDNFRIENPRLVPVVAMAVNSGSLEFTVSYIVDYMERTVMKDRLFTKIADEISNSNGRLDWASSSTTGPNPSVTVARSG
jgi:small-conductance mechanosensitive channel